MEVPSSSLRSSSVKRSGVLRPAVLRARVGAGGMLELFDPAPMRFWSGEARSGPASGRRFVRREKTDFDGRKSAHPEGGYVTQRGPREPIEALNAVPWGDLPKIGAGFRASEPRDSERF